MVEGSRKWANDAPDYSEGHEAVRVRLEKVFKHGENIFERMFADSPIAIILYDPQGKIIGANEVCRNMVGLPDDFDSRIWGNLFKDAVTPSEVKEKLLKGEVVRHETVVDYDDLRTRGLYRGARSGICHIDALYSPLGPTDEGRAIGYMCQVQDVTVLRQTQGELVAYQTQLRSLSSKLSLAEEQERRRLADVLHDQVGQILGLAKFRIGALKCGLPEGTTLGQLGEIETLIDEAIQQTRALTFELSPPILYELGLEPALEWLADRYRLTYGISCTVEGAEVSEPLADDLRGMLFSSARELLMNVVKHARAREAKISIFRRAGNVCLKVEDDGVGFDTTDWKVVNRGFGLFNIRERLEAAGGRVEVDSRPAHGTAVSLVVPICASKEDGIEREY